MNAGPVASCLWVDEALESQLYLDGIVTVVDAKHIARHIGKRRVRGEGAGACGRVDRRVVCATSLKVEGVTMAVVLSPLNPRSTSKPP
jgi:G3E family GTPase